jgi:ankyrin repeat protein
MTRVSAGVRLAITNGEDASRAFADGLTPLCRMAALGERRILKILLAARADVNARPGRSTDGSGAKLSAVADQVVEAGFAALHWACREGRTECARLLLEAEATADVRSTDDATPFMLAAKGAWLPSTTTHHPPPANPHPPTTHHPPPTHPPPTHHPPPTTHPPYAPYAP